MVGVASVACGPALTLLVSVFIKAESHITRTEAVIAFLVLLSVAIMLFQSLIGISGISSIPLGQRSVGIASVALCALGTVLYTVASKRLYMCNWKTHEILAVRNLLMLVLCSLVIFFGEFSLHVAAQWVLPMLVLVVVGHLLPVFLVQKTIYHLSALHVSFVFLTLPVFTLLLQYMDSRVNFSLASVVSVGVIVVLLLLLSFSRSTVEEEG